MFYSGCLSNSGLLFHIFPPWLCVRDLLPSFLFLPGFVPSSLLVGDVPFLFSVFFILVRPSCIVCCLLPLLSFAVLPYSSMRFFVVCFLDSGLSLPGPSSLVLLSLHTWSLRVSFFLSCFRPFLLVSSSSLLCVLSSCLFRPWAFP